MVDICYQTRSELTSKFSAFSKDADFKLLTAELSEKGWSKINGVQTDFGFTGTLRDSSGKRNYSVELCLFDYYNKSTKQAATLVWRNDGKSIYKAYVIFKSGEKDFSNAEGIEMFAEGGKIQKANSWYSCFKKAAYKKCPSFCVVSVIVCATALGIPDAGVAVWIGCAGISCGLCFAVCALNCH